MTALVLQPLPVDRPWGGRRIARRFGWDSSRPRGEWWLASCQPGAVSPAGASDLAAWLTGPGRALGLPGPEQFPLLVKFLDCEQLLSLQVHPDDQTARAQGLPNGKTEAWYVLDAAPGACVYLGAAEGVGVRTLLDRVAAGASDDEVRGLLRRVEVASGDALLVPAGTVHAIGEGLALYEIQQNSDTTWRIHDWGRGRPVHLEQARLAARDLAQPPTPVRRTRAGDWETLLACEAFTLRAAQVDGRLGLSTPRRFAVLTALAGRGRVEGKDGARAELAPGATVLLHGPATIEGQGLELLAVDPPR